MSPTRREGFVDQALLLAEKPPGTGFPSSEEHCQGRWLPLLGPACLGWGSWQHPWDVQEGSAQPVPPAPVHCSVPADQVRGHCGAEGQDKPWSCRMAVPELGKGSGGWG